MARNEGRQLCRLRAVTRGQSDQVPDAAVQAFEEAGRMMDRPDAFVLLSAPKYAFPEGKPRKAIAAYAFKDPSNGSGLVAGQAYLFDRPAQIARPDNTSPDPDKDKKRHRARNCFYGTSQKNDRTDRDHRQQYEFIEQSQS